MELMDAASESIAKNFKKIKNYVESGADEFVSKAVIKTADKLVVKQEKI
jgi:hypothetical protein